MSAFNTSAMSTVALDMGAALTPTSDAILAGTSRTSTDGARPARKPSKEGFKK